MKLLKLRAPSGYKMLEKGFELNFLTKTRVDKESNNDDLIELEPNLYYPKETIIVGKNSSGKSTVINYIECALRLLSSGRVYADMADNNDILDIELIFYNDHKVYFYHGVFNKDELSNKDKEYLLISSEELKVADYKATVKKDLSNLVYKPVDNFSPNIKEDTSSLYKYSNTEYELYMNASRFIEDPDAIGTTERIISNMFGDDMFMKVVNIFDDSIEVLDTYYEDDKKTEFYNFKRINDKEKSKVSASFLEEHLSDGTIRGVTLYGLLLMLFEDGGILVIDEIEKNFNKNLIGNLVDMINDPSVNRGQGTIIYSTHYSELLDQTSRCDNINVLHRNGTTISLKNMHSDYRTRTDMLKSNQFDQNCFDNNINYDYLLNLKKAIRG